MTCAGCGFEAQPDFACCARCGPSRPQAGVPWSRERECPRLRLSSDPAGFESSLLVGKCARAGLEGIDRLPSDEEVLGAARAL